MEEQQKGSNNWRQEWVPNDGRTHEYNPSEPLSNGRNCAHNCDQYNHPGRVGGRPSTWLPPYAYAEQPTSRAASNHQEIEDANYIPFTSRQGPSTHQSGFLFQLKQGSSFCLLPLPLPLDGGFQMSLLRFGLGLLGGGGGWGRCHSLCVGGVGTLSVRAVWEIVGVQPEGCGRLGGCAAVSLDVDDDV